MAIRSTFRQPISVSAAFSAKSELERDISVVRACAIILVTIAACAAGVAAADLLAPTAIAIVLALILAPVAQSLERWRVPSGVSAVITVVFTALALIALAMMLSPSVKDWAARAPEIVRSVEHKLRPIKASLAAVESASQQIAHMPTSASTATSVVVVPPPMVSSDEILTSVVQTAPGLVAKCIFVTILTIFLLACRRQYTHGLILLPRSFVNRVRMARICRDVRHRVSGYLFTLAMINVGLAIVTTICFTIAGIEDAVVWGLAFGILNFVPVVGPTVIILAAAVVGFATSNNIMGALLPPLILMGLDTVEANLVQPWLLSRRIVISPVAIFVTVATLVWMWGPAAAITAVPAMILFHAIARHVPSLRPIGLLLATEHPRGVRNGNGHQPGLMRFARLSTGRSAIKNWP